MTSSKKKRILGIVLPLTALLLLGCVWLAVRFTSSRLLSIHYYYDNDCGACDPERDFVALFNEKLGDIKEQADFSLKMQNLYLHGHEGWTEECDALEIPQEQRGLPMLIVGDRVLAGQEAIERELRIAFCESAGIADQGSVWYFYRPECGDCVQVAPTVDAAMEKHPELQICQIDTTDPAPKERFKRLLREWKVPEDEWQVPFLIYNAEYLSGDAAIEERLLDLLNGGSSLQ